MAYLYGTGQLHESEDDENRASCCPTTTIIRPPSSLLVVVVVAVVVSVIEVDDEEIECEIESEKENRRSPGIERTTTSKIGGEKAKGKRK